MGQLGTRKNNSGLFKKGEGGRPKGVQNHITKTVKETVLSVFQQLQGDEKNNLKAFAEKYPRDFYQIAAKLIPTELTGTLKTIIDVTEPGEESSSQDSD